MKLFFKIPVFLFLLCNLSTNAQLGLPSFLQDNSILQRERTINFSGLGIPEDSLSFEMGTIKIKTIVNQLGKWQLILPPQKAGGPHLLKFTSGETTKTMENVYFGDVWLIASDDSCNLEGNKSSTLPKNYLNRIVQLKKNISMLPTWKNNSSQWIFTNQLSKEYSFYTKFAEKLSAFSNVPIGIIVANFPESSIENWLSPEVVKTLPDLNTLYVENKTRKYNLDSITLQAAKNRQKQKKTNKTKANSEFYSNFPCIVFNGMLTSVITYPLKGILLSTGKNNLHNPKKYGYLLPALVLDWRANNKNENLPFLEFQLPSMCNKDSSIYKESFQIRESQRKAEKVLRNYKILCSIDSENNTSTERNADRLLTVIRELVENTEFSNTTYFAQKRLVNDTAYLVEFHPENSGLMVSDNKELRGFEICGFDSVFVPAKAILKENKIIVWNKTISHPTGVRYMWDACPANANLTNKNGIPVCPFYSR